MTKIKKTSKIKKIIKGLGQGTEYLLEFKDTLKDPVGSGIKKLAHKAANLDTRTKRNGNNRERAQFLTKNGWMKRDTKKNINLGVKKDGSPWKRIRKIKHKKKSKSK